MSNNKFSSPDKSAGDEKPENAPATAEPAKQPEGTPKNAPDQKPAVNNPK